MRLKRGGGRSAERPDQRQCPEVQFIPLWSLVLACGTCSRMDAPHNIGPLSVRGGVCVCFRTRAQLVSNHLSAWCTGRV